MEHAGLALGGEAADGGWVKAMKPFTAIAAVIFLLMALVHLYRLAAGFPISVGSVSIGQEVSWIALVVTLVLAVGLFREARR